MAHSRKILAIVTGLITSVTAASSFGADVRISHEFVRSVPMVSSNSAGYMTLENKNKKVIRLESVDTDIAAKTEIHGHRMKDDMMGMFKVEDGLELPPGKKVRLESGGYHIMLMGLKSPLKAGDTVELTLHFSDGDAVDVKMPVKDTGALRGIKLSNGSVRATVPGMSTSAAYFTISNENENPVQLSGIESPVAKKSELHTTLMKGGMMRMQEVEQLIIPAGEKVELKPGGYHVMLMGLNKQIQEGEKVPVTMTFSDGQKVTIENMAMKEIKNQGMAH